MDNYGNNQQLDDDQDFNNEINLDQDSGMDNFTDINEKVRDYEKNKNNSVKNNKQEVKDIKNVYGNNNNDNVNVDIKHCEKDHTDTLDENVSVTIVIFFN